MRDRSGFSPSPTRPGRVRTAGVEESGRAGGIDGVGDSEVRKISAGDAVKQEYARPVLPELGEGGERQRVVRGEEANGGALAGGVPGIAREEESGWRIEQGDEECRRAGQRGEG